MLLILASTLELMAGECRQCLTIHTRLCCISSSLKTAENLEVVKQLPADKLLIETGTILHSLQDIDKINVVWIGTQNLCELY